VKWLKALPLNEAVKENRGLMKDKKQKNISVVLVESMRADDIYDNLLEADAIAQILQLLGVHAVSKKVIDKRHLSKAIREARKSKASIFHLSCHANGDGFELTADYDLHWSDLAGLAGKRLEDMVLCLSACEAGNIAVSEVFAKTECPPAFIVGPEHDVDYAQACVAWSVFYHYLARRGIGKEQMKSALDRMNSAIDGSFIYRRWTGKLYLRYPKKKK